MRSVLFDGNIRLKNGIFFSIALKAKTLMCVPYNAHYWWIFCEFM